MKKIGFNLQSSRKRLFFRNFCLLIIFLLGDVFSIYADTLHEDVRLNIHVENKNALYIFNLIKKQTSFNFVYNDRDLVQVGFKTLNLEGATLKMILDELVEGTDLTYEFMGNVVIFKRQSAVKQDTIKEYVITGKVVDENKYPLPGVTVLLKKTDIGVATNTKGEFKITLPKKDTTIVLVFSFVGMVTKEIKVGNRTIINVTLKEEIQNLKDVVITGYTSISRKSYTGNVTTITADELKKVSTTNILKSIQIFDPSFRIAVNNEMGSDPNTLPEISIRGASGIGITELEEASVSQTALRNNPNLPTFILDGFEVSVEKVYDLDVNRIESINILKDAAATAIYGSRAANGVIVITTIAPRTGEVLMTYNYDLVLEIPDLSDYNLMNAREKIEAEYAAGLFEGRNIEGYHRRLFNLEKGVNTDWMALPLRNAINNKHYFRLEGGGRELRYAIDVSYFGNKGVMRGSERKTFGIGFELQYNLANRFIFRNIANYSATNSEESPYGSFSQYTTMNPYLSYQDENGKILFLIPTLTSNNTVINPLYEATLDSYNSSYLKEFTNNFTMQYWLPSKKINFRFNLALTYNTRGADSYVSPESGRYNIVLNPAYKGEKTLSSGSVTNIDGGLFGYYNDVINNHYINLVIGVNMKESRDENMSIYMRDLPAGGFANPQFAREVPNPPNANGQTSRLFGAMISTNYTYNNIYLFDVTGRLDGNSSFGSKKRMAPFWSFGVGINFHRYAFMENNLGWISELKIRGSYGITGKANFPARTARTVYGIGEQETYPTGLTANMLAMGNVYLKWEKTRILDFGFNLNIGNGVFILNGTYYLRRTVDLIADMYVPSSSGFTSYKENVGEILNKGYELSFRTRLWMNDNLQWYIGANLAANENEISKISDAMKSYNKAIEEKYQRSNTVKPFMKYEEGASTTSIYAMQSQGIDPQTGKEMYLRRDGSSTFTWSSEENVVCGNTEPKINGSLFSNLYWNGLTVDLYFSYTYGRQQYNQTLQAKIENANIEENVDRRVFTDRWQKPGDVTLFKSLKDWQKYTQTTSRFVQDDNTLILQAINIGYDFPSGLVGKWKLERVRLMFNINDVFRLSSIKQERGTSYPFSHKFNFSINVGF